MASSIAAITTGSGGIVSTGDSSGNLNLVSGTTTIVAVTSSGVSVTGTLTASGTTTLTTPILGTPTSGNLTNCTGITMPAGSVLQVVSTFKNDVFSSSSTSYVDVTGLTVSITPASASNKILVLISLATAGGAGLTAWYNLQRGSSNIAQPSSGANLATAHLNTPNSTVGRDWSLVFLDSPATTSSTTYKMQGKTDSSTFYVNQRGDNATDTTVSSITVMEIKG